MYCILILVLAVENMYKFFKLVMVQGITLVIIVIYMILLLAILTEYGIRVFKIYEGHQHNRKFEKKVFIDEKKEGGEDNDRNKKVNSDFNSSKANLMMLHSLGDISMVKEVEDVDHEGD